VATAGADRHAGESRTQSRMVEQTLIESLKLASIDRD
jgi:hypothetical protein